MMSADVSPTNGINMQTCDIYLVTFAFNTTDHRANRLAAFVIEPEPGKWFWTELYREEIIKKARELILASSREDDDIRKLLNKRNVHRYYDKDKESGPPLVRDTLDLYSIQRVRPDHAFVPA